MSLLCNVSEPAFVRIINWNLSVSAFIEICTNYYLCLYVICKIREIILQIHATIIKANCRQQNYKFRILSRKNKQIINEYI